MGVRLAFVDDPDRLAEVPDGCVVVAADPFVAIATGAEEAIPLDARLDDLELEALGEQTFARVGVLCDALDELVLGRPARDADPTVRWRFQELKAFYDGSLAAALGAKRLAGSLAADEAILLLRPDTLAARILPATLEGSGVAVTVAAAAAAGQAAPPRLSASDRLASARTRIRRAGRRRRPRVLCLDTRYSVPAIVAALRDRGADPLLWLPPPSRPESLGVVGLDGLAPLFDIGGVDLWPAAQTFLRRVVERESADDAAAFRAALAAIRRDRPDALLSSTFARPEAKAAAVAARSAGVPSLAARHGELAVRELPMMVFNDLDVADVVLSWGEWEARYIERHAPRPVRSIVVGAPMLEEAIATALPRADGRRRLGLADDELVALFVPTALNQDDWFAGRRTPLDLSYARHQIGVVEQLLAVDGLRVLAKEHPGSRALLDRWMRATGAPLGIVRDWTFPQLLHVADAVVLDLPSTTLVQALFGSARIYIVANPLTAWEPGVLEHLRGYSVAVVPSGELSERLRADRAAGLLRSPVAYPPSAREPLVASGPGSAAGRAADAILAVAAGAPTTITDQ